MSLDSDSDELRDAFGNVLVINILGTVHLHLGFD